MNKILRNWLKKEKKHIDPIYHDFVESICKKIYKLFKDYGLIEYEDEPTIIIDGAYLKNDKMDMIKKTISILQKCKKKKDFDVMIKLINK